MEEILFVVKMLVLSVLVIMGLQMKFDGQSLDQKASLYFSSSKPIHWIQDQGKLLKKTFTKTTKKIKTKIRQGLDEKSKVTINEKSIAVNKEEIQKLEKPLPENPKLESKIVEDLKNDSELLLEEENSQEMGL